MNTVVDFTFDRDLNEAQILDKVNESLNDLHVPNVLFLKKGQIRFFPKNILEVRSKEFAINFIDSIQMNVAIPIAGDLPPVDTKAVLDCKEKLEAAKARYAKVDADTSVKNFSYEFIQCPHCRSRLNREYLPDGSICPLCHIDLRKEAALAKLAKVQEKVTKAEEELAKAIEDSRKEGIAKGPEKWFVRVYIDCTIGESSLISFDYTEHESLSEIVTAPVELAENPDEHESSTLNEVEEINELSDAENKTDIAHMVEESGASKGKEGSSNE